MNYKKIITTAALIICIIHSGWGQKTPFVSVQDLKMVSGCWQGQMNYLSTIYSKPHTVAADLVIRQTGRSNTFTFSTIYPKEPKANTTETIIISKDGRKINDETVKSKRRKNDGITEIVTEVAGIDEFEKKPAIFRYTYTFGKNSYTHRKDIQLTGQTDWIERNEFNYSRKNCR